MTNPTEAAKQRACDLARAGWKFVRRWGWPMAYAVLMVLFLVSHQWALASCCALIATLFAENAYLKPYAEFGKALAKQMAVIAPNGTDWQLTPAKSGHTITRTEER